MNRIIALARPLLRCPICATPLAFTDQAARCDWSHCFRFEGPTLVLNQPADAPRSAAAESSGSLLSGLAWRFEQAVYMRHNSSPAVRRALAKVLSTIGPEDVGLNIGSGWTRLHERMLNLEVTPNPMVDLTGDAHALPFVDNSLKCVVSQEVFEHLPRPWDAMHDVARVLAPGGTVYIQVPFVIGLHSVPHDFYRFTPYGLKALVEAAGLEVVEIAPAVGAGTALYRVLVEFAGSLMATPWSKLYRPAKAGMALLAAPVRWVDAITLGNHDSNRVSGGYYVIATKPASPALTKAMSHPSDRLPAPTEEEQS